jgi:hypothetical protein
MKGDAVKHRQMFHGDWGFQNLLDGLNQGAMLVLENGAIGAPRRFGVFSLLWAREEIASF